MSTELLCIDKGHIREHLMEVITVIRPGCKELPFYVTDLAFDEIELVELIIECEDALDIVIDDETFFSCTSFDEIISYLLVCREEASIVSLQE